MYCPNCGAANDDASIFCVNCGTALAVPPSNVSGTYSQYGPTGQMPSRNEKRDILIIVGAVIVVAMLMFAGLAVLLGNGLSGSASGNPSNNNAINNVGNDAVSINKINMAIDYEGTSSGYFGPSIQSQTSDLTTSPGDEFTDHLTLTNTDLSTSQNVTGIAVQSPFALDSIDPSIPSSISPGSSVTYSLTITAPSMSGDYWMSMTVTTGALNNNGSGNSTQGSNNFTVSYTWAYPYYTNNEWTLNVTIPASTYWYYTDQPKTYDFASYATPDDPIVDQTAGLLKNDAENNSYDVGQFVLSFVQSIQYGTDQNTSGQVNYPRFPDETLVDKVGDCKDHSTLYYSLMGSPEINIGVVLFQLTPPTGTVGHMAVGIWKIGGTGSYVQNDGKDYYYCETTATGWLIGEKPPQFDNYTIQVLST